MIEVDDFERIEKQRVAREEKRKARQTEIKVFGECPKKGHSVFDGGCDRCDMDDMIEDGLACKIHRREYDDRTKCRLCEIKEIRASIEGVNWHANHGRADHEIKKVSELDPFLTRPFIDARKRTVITTMNNDDEAIKTVQLIVKNYRKPHLNTIQDQSGTYYDHRKVIWGVNIESGVGLSFILNHNGIANFKITSDRWLKIQINKDLTIREILKR